MDHLHLKWCGAPQTSPFFSSPFQTFLLSHTFAFLSLPLFLWSSLSPKFTIYVFLSHNPSSILRTIPLPATVSLLLSTTFTTAESLSSLTPQSLSLSLSWPQNPVSLFLFVAPFAPGLADFGSALLIYNYAFSDE